ncbi:nitroreductase/quinone reductase family protein [Cellulomonas edaphi]|uniref:Nitroreductase/quinone reductase family protein n=1 Tax=Cellulomonas edaphi TaxID=3053468 RepID=A0ABT7S889_9CELL|nr:nitroreductase/quinone reductase family protein [Cellulomons edaphi]MDM7831843.1 nitroreductase/quinone reductase family protein [Cellulomons edaphi]
MVDAQQREINARVIEQFRAGGEVEGMHRERLLLLTTTGRTSGERRTTPMMFHVDPGPPPRHVVIASNMGAADDPAWCTNLVADPAVHVELADEEFDARAVVASGAEHDRLWADITAAYPFFLDHLARAGRTIPLVVLEHA